MPTNTVKLVEQFASFLRTSKKPKKLETHIIEKFSSLWFFRNEHRKSIRQIQIQKKMRVMHLTLDVGL